MEPQLRPASSAVAIKDCDAALFPSIIILLQIACTIPVTSCECERSASTLRRLNNYMRASMGKDRLSHLALLHSLYTTPVDFDTVVDCYARSHPRRLRLEIFCNAVPLICLTLLTLKVRLKRKRTHPGKNQPTGLNISGQKYYVIFPYQKTATAMARPSSTASICQAWKSMCFMFHGKFRILCMWYYIVYLVQFAYFFKRLPHCRDLQMHVPLKIWRMKKTAKVRMTSSILSGEKSFKYLKCHYTWPKTL